MPVDLSAWDLSRMLMTFLLGVLITAAVFGVPLVRTRQRNARLRRQVARLTTATALFVTPEHSRDDGGGGAPTDEGIPHPAASAPEPPGQRDPSEQSPVPQGPAEKEVQVPAFPSEEPHEIDPTHPRHHDAMHGYSGIDAPTEPVQPEHRPVAECNGNGNGHDQPEMSSFATDEAADRFRREYDEPMAEARDRIARLRAQLHEVPTATTNGHGGPGGHT